MIKNNYLFLFLFLAGSCQNKPDMIRATNYYQGSLAFEEYTLAFEVGGRLKELSLQRGDIIAVGASVALLDDSLLRPGLDARRADKKAAEARLALLRAGARPEDLASVSAQLKAAKTTEANIASNLSRQESLVSSGAAASATIDDLTAQLSRAKAERRLLEERWSTLHSGARDQEIEAAEAQVEAASAAINAEETRLTKYALASPFAGYVSEVFFEPGEVLSPGAPLATLLNTTRPYVDIFVPQGKLAGLSLKKEASIQVDGHSGSLCGYVESIGKQAEFTPKFIFSEQERPNIVFRVRVRVHDEKSVLHAGVPTFISFEKSCAPNTVSSK
jgi:HlyD family secretion protein